MAYFFNAFLVYVIWPVEGTREIDASVTRLATTFKERPKERVEYMPSCEQYMSTSAILTLK
jgi:hypothetical protein